MNRHPRGGSEGGFSLVELLVVIAIIGILATTVTVKVIGALAQARVTKAKAEISEMKKAVGIYQIQNSGRIPESIEDLKTPAQGEEEGILPEDFTGRDPWGNMYEYEKTGTRKFIIRSLGGDGQPGGEGQDADIDSDHLSDDPDAGSGSGN